MTKRYPFTLIKEKLAAHQGKALDFAVGKWRLTLPKAIDNWVSAHANLALRPATRIEVDEFTVAAKELLVREYGAVVDTVNILPTPGGRAAMSAFVACAIEPGNSVLVTNPGYPAFARLAAHQHARVHDVPLDSENLFMPDFGASPNDAFVPPRVIALNYPNNPTGVTLTPETIASISDVAQAGTIVFNDATYGPLVYAHKPNSLLGAYELGHSQFERVELHSFSKLFPLGPIALSFLAGSAKIMQDVSTYSEFAWSPPSMLQLRVTTKCLQDAVRLEELRAFFPERLENLRQALVEIGFEPYPTPAGVYVLCRVPAGIAGMPVSSAEEAAVRLMDEFDLAVVPFDTHKQKFLRFSSLYDPTDLDKLADLRGQLKLADI